MDDAEHHEAGKSFLIKNDVYNICFREVSHGIVMLEQDLNDFSHIFVDLVTPAIEWRFGFDINIEGLRDRFDATVPIDQRRALAMQIIAIAHTAIRGRVA